MNKPRTHLAHAALVVVLAPLFAACVPSPEDVCGHAMELMKKQLGADADTLSADKLESFEKDCVENAKKDKDKDLKAYKNRTKCVMAADSLEDLHECDRAEKAAKKGEG